jgi:hypothetical protein
MNRSAGRSLAEADHGLDHGSMFLLGQQDGRFSMRMRAPRGIIARSAGSEPKQTGGTIT